MGQNLTQPEEIEQALKSMNEGELDRSIAKKAAFKDLIREERTVGYLSAYRAAYLKNHPHLE